MRPVKREKRTFVKVHPRARVGSGMISARDLAMFNRAQQLAFSRAEKKNIDTAFTVNGGQVPAFGVTTGIVTLLNGCTAAATPTSRVGRRISMHSLAIRGHVFMGATSTGSQAVRVIIFYDKQTNKTAPAATDVLSGDSVQGQMLLANSHRFRVLRDIVVPCTGTAGPQSQYIDVYLKLKGLEAEFIDGAGAGTVADVTSGGLFALVYANQNVGTASAQTNINMRLRFTDM